MAKGKQVGEIELIMNYVAMKRRYVVVSYRPGAVHVPAVGTLIQEFSARPISKLLRTPQRNN